VARCFDRAMLPPKRAAELAAKLGLDVYETGICLPCLSIVAFALDKGDEPKTRGATVSMTPDFGRRASSCRRGSRSSVPAHSE
jgi:hypothetical protein